MSDKITSLHQANEYLKDVALYLWQKENIIHCITSTPPVMTLRFTEQHPCKSMSEALSRLHYYTDKHRASDKAYKSLNEQQQQAVRDAWQKERESYKAFNEIVQGYYPPHR